MAGSDRIRDLLTTPKGGIVPILQRPQPAAAAAVTGDREAAGPETLMSADSRHLLAAWQDWRGDALVPRRSAMDLVTISRLMPRLVVLDVHGPGHAVFRLAGTEVEEQYGQRLTGRSYVKMVPAERQARRGALMWRIAQQPCGALQHVRLGLASGGHRDLEIFGLPMRPDRDSEPAQMLGVISRLPPPVWGRQQDPVTGLTSLALHLIDIGAGIPPAA